MLMFFGVMTIDSFCGERFRLGCLQLAKSVSTLLAALVVGCLAIGFYKFCLLLKGELVQIEFCPKYTVPAVYLYDRLSGYLTRKKLAAEPVRSNAVASHQK